jgi:PAS domain S-box-containing protein
VIHVLKSGRRIRVALTLQPVTDEAGVYQGTVGTVRDLTAEYAEQERGRLNERVALQTTDGVLIAASEPGDPSGPLHLIHVNAAFSRLTRFGLEDLRGHLGRLFGPRTDRAALQKLAQAHLEQRAGRTETVIYARNGQPLWVECSANTAVLHPGGPVYWTATVRDLSQQVKQRALDHDRRNLMEAALHQSQTEIMPLVIRMLEGQFPDMGVALVLNLDGEEASSVYSSGAFFRAQPGADGGPAAHLERPTGLCGAWGGDRAAPRQALRGRHRQSSGNRPGVWSDMAAARCRAGAGWFAGRATAKSKLSLHLISHQSGTAANLHHLSA